MKRPHTSFPFLHVCPVTGKIKGIKLPRALYLLLFPIAGFCALVWFCIRVIPKPSRATYPCQRVAAPIAGGFIAWLTALFATMGAWKGLRHTLRRKKVIAAVMYGVAVIGAGTYTALNTATPVRASLYGKALLTQNDSPQPYDDYTAVTPNDPVGEAKGINPGRVVWAHHPDATDENCLNMGTDYWWKNDNTDPQKVKAMLGVAVCRLTGAQTKAAAWDSLFRHFNRQYGRGDNGYRAGEKIAIKVNLCSAYWNPASHVKHQEKYMTDTSPQLMCAVLHHLIHVADVAPSDITIGDPIRSFFDDFYSIVHAKFPDVNYVDPAGGNGRIKAQPCDSGRLFLSGKNNANDSIVTRLPESFVQASYMLNLGVLKAHGMAGISTCAKNHYGSHCEPLLSDSTLTAKHLHFALPRENPGWGKYRALVDLMGHRHLGRKTLLHVVDALWGDSMSIGEPSKWKSAPFNNDWPSSILISQDPVAIEAVSLDILRNEYDTTNGYALKSCRPYLPGTDDFLLQAADSSYWPADITYDPENDASAIPSLGVYEHWNNATEKQYSRNIDPDNGRGIELVMVEKEEINPVKRGPRSLASAHDHVQIENRGNGYPRLHFCAPTESGTPPSRHLRVSLLRSDGTLLYRVYNGTIAPQGMMTLTLQNHNGTPLASGSYICRVQTKHLNISKTLHIVK